MDQEELDQLLKAHSLWLEDPGQNGASRLKLVKKDLSGLGLVEADLERCVLRGCDVSNADAVGVELEQADISDCDFSGSDLSKAFMYRVTANGTDFSDSQLDYANMRDSLIHGADFDSASMHNCDLQDCDASENDEYFAADFSNSNLNDARFDRSNLSMCKFVNCSLIDASFYEANLSGVTFARSDATRADFLMHEGRVITPPSNLEGAFVCGTELHPMYGATWSDAEKLLDIDISEVAYVNDEQYYIVSQMDIGIQEVATEKEIDEAIDNAWMNCSQEDDPTGSNAFWEALEDKGPFLNFEVVQQLGVETGLDMAVFVPDVSEEYARTIVDSKDLDVDIYEEVVDDVFGVTIRGRSAINIQAAVDAINEAKSKKPYPMTSYGPWRTAAKALKKVTMPMKLAAFKKAFPEAFDQIKDDIDTGTLTPKAAEELLGVYGITWQITETVWDSNLQTLSPKYNNVLQMNIDPAVVTDDPEILKTIEAIRQTSLRSGHPVNVVGLFTIGWVRYNVFKKGESHAYGFGGAISNGDILLVEEIQSDLPIVRKGLDDQEFKDELRQRGMTDESIRIALKALHPFVMFFYQDALSLMFDIAHEAGLEVEMLSYQQKERFGSPKSLYEKLPKSMGMKKGASKLDFIEGRVWRIKPNPARRRAKKIRVPKTWSRRSRYR